MAEAAHIWVGPAPTLTNQPPPDELEQMLFQLPLAGSAFKKVYFDPVFEQPRSVFVPAEDFVAPYGASDLTTCERYTHVMKKSSVEVLQLQAAGFYDAVELPDPAPEMTDIQEKYSELAGEGALLKMIEERRKKLAADAHFYGLGEKTGPLDKRGAW